MNDIRYARDILIPTGNITGLVQYLTTQEKMLENKYFKLRSLELVIWTIEQLLGEAIFINNILIISKLNSFIDEFNLKINKINVIKNIYYAECRNNRNKSTISFVDLKRIRDEYIFRYYWII